MPVRSVQTTAAAGALPWVPLNVHSDDPQVQWSYNRSGNGSITAAVQYTLDNVLDPDVSALAIQVTALSTAVHAAHLGHPATAIRLNITAASGANTVTFRVLQTGV